MQTFFLEIYDISLSNVQYCSKTSKSLKRINRIRSSIIINQRNQKVTEVDITS